MPTKQKVVDTDLFMEIVHRDFERRNNLIIRSICISEIGT